MRRSATNLGKAISYRFKRDGKGWRVFVSTRMMDVSGGYGPAARRHRGGPECRPSRCGGYQWLGQLRECLAEYRW